MNRTYRDAAVALTWIACDTKPDGTPASSTPKRVLENGPWWQAAVISGDANGGRPNPPKRHEQCRRCGGVLPACACTRDHLAAEPDPPAPTLPPVGEVSPGLAQRLAGLSTTTFFTPCVDACAGRCACGEAVRAEAEGEAK